MTNIEQYRVLAAEAERQADETNLPSVRARCERSAAAWRTIIGQMADTEKLAAVNLAAKAAS